jgi:pyrroline-5-carboxylate reductase
MNSSATKIEAREAATARAQKKIAVIGCGKMGSILLQAFLELKLVCPDEVTATVQHEEKEKEKGRALTKNLDTVALSTDNRAAVAHAPVVLLCVKPQVLPQVLEEIASSIATNALVISIAASTTVGFIQQKLGKDVAVVRAMPNTPATVGAAMTALCAGAAVRPEQLTTAKKLFEAVGRVAIVDEKHMDAITALSASGPAFVFVILESLAEAGVKVGLPREMATTLAAQTLFGSAKLALETGHHPALLKDAVTTPAGCTIEGLMELERGGLRVTLMQAVITTTKRAKELMTS